MMQRVREVCDRLCNDFERNPGGYLSIVIIAFAVLVIGYAIANPVQVP